MVAWLGCILLWLTLDFVLVACAADFTLGPETTAYELGAVTSLAATNAGGVMPFLVALGVTNARLIAPGDAARCLIVNRANDSTIMEAVPGFESDRRCRCRTTHRLD